MHLTRFPGALIFVLCLAVADCGRATHGDMTDITGVMPSLAFSMIRANDDAPVGAANYRGKAVLLYFGYTHCPDECPTTLAHLATTLKQLGQSANSVRVLFVTVDPERDSIPVLKTYVRSFGPQIDALRGSPNAVATLARRYRVLYTVTAASPGGPYSVMHSDSVFMFDGRGQARFVTTSTDDSEALAQRIRQLLADGWY
ncbi:MAG TPA: SCO family protein [Rhizomicrobium sp.]